MILYSWRARGKSVNNSLENEDCCKRHTEEHDQKQNPSCSFGALLLIHSALKSIHLPAHLRWKSESRSIGNGMTTAAAQKSARGQAQSKPSVVAAEVTRRK